MPNHPLTRYNAVPPTRSRAGPPTKVRHVERIRRRCLDAALRFMLTFGPVSFSVPAPGLSVSVKRSQGDSAHIPEDYGRKSSGSSAKVPPSPLTTTDRKKTPTPSTVSSHFLPVNAGGVGDDDVIVFDANCSFFFCRIEQHSFNWYESWEKLARSWEVYSGCTEWQRQVGT